MMAHLDLLEAKRKASVDGGILGQTAAPQQTRRRRINQPSRRSARPSIPTSFFYLNATPTHKVKKESVAVLVTPHQEKRKRGRPKKTDDNNGEPLEKRKRGRPRKNAKVEEDSGQRLGKKESLITPQRTSVLIDLSGDSEERTAANKRQQPVQTDFLIDGLDESTSHKPRASPLMANRKVNFKHPEPVLATISPPHDECEKKRSHSAPPFNKLSFARPEPEFASISQPDSAVQQGSIERKKKTRSARTTQPSTKRSVRKTRGRPKKQPSEPVLASVSVGRSKKSSEPPLASVSVGRSKKSSEPGFAAVIEEKQQPGWRDCGVCIVCRNGINCGNCEPCLNMTEFGGDGRLGAKCILRVCLTPVLDDEAGRTRQKVNEKRRVKTKTRARAVKTALQGAMERPTPSSTSRHARQLDRRFRSRTPILGTLGETNVGANDSNVSDGELDGEEDNEQTTDDNVVSVMVASTNPRRSQNKRLHQPSKRSMSREVSSMLAPMKETKPRQSRRRPQGHLVQSAPVRQREAVGGVAVKEVVSRRPRGRPRKTDPTKQREAAGGVAVKETVSHRRRGRARKTSVMTEPNLVTKHRRKSVSVRFDESSGFNGSAARVPKKRGRPRKISKSGKARQELDEKDHGIYESNKTSRKLHKRRRIRKSGADTTREYEVNSENDWDDANNALANSDSDEEASGSGCATRGIESLTRPPWYAQTIARPRPTRISRCTTGLPASHRGRYGRVPRLVDCGQCIVCRRGENCGDCEACLNMVEFGGDGSMKAKCFLRVCITPVVKQDAMP